MDKKYFHKVTKKELKSLYGKGLTWNYIMDNYKQPSWCGYTDALNGLMGCWSLTGELRTKISKKFCNDCECFKHRQHADPINSNTVNKEGTQ